MFYTLLNDAYGEPVRMLYTDTDSCFCHLFVEDLAKEINARLYFQDAFDSSGISLGHLSKIRRSGAGLHAGKVGYFKDETKGNPIIKFVNMRPTKYSFTVCEASELIARLKYLMDVRYKAVAKGVARSQIKRLKHEDYVQMYNGKARTKVIICRIGSNSTRCD